MPQVVIFANGISGHIEKNRQYIHKGDYIICADGGTLYALEMGLRPDLIVGDFDSLPPAILEQVRQMGVRIEQYPADKGKTDLELALQEAERFGATDVLILTALGGRMDQFLANIMLLSRPDWPFRQFRIADGYQQGWALTGPAELHIQGEPGDILSVVPLSERIEQLDLLGVQWPLAGAKVERGSTLTLSNVFLGNKVVVTFARGICLVVRIESRDIGEL